LDFGGNALRHGPVDQLRVGDAGPRGNGEAPAKECPECHEVIAAGYATCPACGHAFPPRQHRQHDGQATDAAILSDQSTRTEHEVTDIFYAMHTKCGAPPDAPRTMRVDYRIGFNEYVSEWICFEHTGYPRAKAEQWWRRRSNEPVPDTAEQAVEFVNIGALARTLKITIERWPGDRFDRIVAHELGPKPPRPDSDQGLPEYAITDDEIPF
jgi:DNA repair protein RadD